MACLPEPAERARSKGMREGQEMGGRGAVQNTGELMVGDVVNR